MTDITSSLPEFSAEELPDRMSNEDVARNRHAEAALQRHKREGLELALRARWAGLAIVALLLPILHFHWSMLYYHGLLACLAFVGWLQWRYGRVGRSKLELLLLFFELLLMTFALVFPNPFDQRDLPDAMVYHYDNFIFLFLTLAGGSLAYSWRTIFAIGTWTTVLWLGAAGLMAWFGARNMDLTTAIDQALPDLPSLAELLDPNSVHWTMRIQEVVVFMTVAVTLGLGVRRFNRLLLGNAALERERENLSRYFSPNVVDELSRNDDPLKQTRNHNVAVMFVDIVGFTSYAADRHPEEVIKTLREFHGQMETEVFSNGGTLDKYLGDGLMATFGTPTAGEKDATAALHCARDMISTVARWNTQRQADGDPEIALSIGLHFGPVVLGDIGANRLEFAVIGNTVNVASRLEAMTRSLGVRVVVSNDLRRQVERETEDPEVLFAGLVRQDGAQIRGLDRSMTVWTLD